MECVTIFRAADDYVIEKWMNAPPMILSENKTHNLWSQWRSHQNSKKHKHPTLCCHRLELKTTHLLNFDTVKTSKVRFLLAFISVHTNALGTFSLLFQMETWIIEIWSGFFFTSSNIYCKGRGTTWTGSQYKHVSILWITKIIFNCRRVVAHYCFIPVLHEGTAGLHLLVLFALLGFSFEKAKLIWL